MQSPLYRSIPAGDHAFYDLFTSTFKVGKTISYRLASSKLLGVYGNNQQNVADETRQMFVPAPGFRFNQNDYEGAEAVAVAMLCREGNFRECVRRRVKIHNFVCVKIFPDKFTEFFSDIEIELLTPQTFAEHGRYKEVVKRCKELKTEYDLAKRTVHMANYMGGWETFQKFVLAGTKGRVVLSAAHAKQLLGSYFDLFPEVKEYQLDTEAKIKLMEPLFNLFGHPARFIQRFTTEVARLGVSWSPQSTIGVAMIIGALNHQRWIEEAKAQWHIHNIVHDSGLQSAPADEIEEAAAIFAENMKCELTSPIDGWKFAVGVEKSIGDNWGKYDEASNPAGLKVIP